MREWLKDGPQGTSYRSSISGDDGKEPLMWRAKERGILVWEHQVQRLAMQRSLGWEWKGIQCWLDVVNEGGNSPWGPVVLNCMWDSM